MRRVGWFAIAVSAMLASQDGEARLTRITVRTTEQVAPVKPGAPAYRILRGTYDGELDPRRSAQPRHHRSRPRDAPAQ